MKPTSPLTDYPRQPNPNRGSNFFIVLGLLTGVALGLGGCPRGYAMNHGFDPDAPATKWFETLRIPPQEQVSCCGKADAYPVDRYTKLPNGDYEVWIEDGSAKAYPDGTRRIAWDESVPIKVPAERVNKEDDDLSNPTDHGWLFFIPQREYPADGGEAKPSTKVSTIYCFIRHPQGN